MSRPSIPELEVLVVNLTAEHVGVPRNRVLPSTRPVQDLGIDSLDLIEWMMAIEERFDVTLPDPDRARDPVYKEVFTRADFTIGDMAELIHIRWGSGGSVPATQSGAVYRDSGHAAFSQLGGKLSVEPQDLYRELEPSMEGIAQFRRMTDGMVCIKLPADTVEIGGDWADAFPDEKPKHSIDIDTFLIDREVVSTTAFCRFLNSVAETDDAVLKSWFLISPDERRFTHQLIHQRQGVWLPKTGVEEWPMVLVSWHGANAYSLWANGRNWRSWAEGNGEYLPAECQWEYAARGKASKRWPWGDRAPKAGEINAGIHARNQQYEAYSDLPIASVHARTAVSPFGVFQMAGNVWQWCRDWYDPEAYQALAERRASPHRTVRSERGGSWVSPIELSRSSYRRGRIPSARGRCLGFRCIGK